MNTPQDVLNVARSQIGTLESPPGSNNVPYWAAIGRPDLQGESWCACFVTWCMKQSGVPFPTIDTPGGYVYCPDAVTFGRSHGELTSNPQPGDIALFDWEHDSIADHTGIVESISATQVTTIDGNSDDKVERATRSRSLVIAFFHPPYGSSAQSGSIPVTTTAGNIQSVLVWYVRRHGMLDTVPGGDGFIVARPDGAVDSYDGAPNFGSMAGRKMNAPVVGIAFTNSGKGYWLVGEDGGIFNFGDAPLLGPALHYMHDWNVGIGTQSPIIGIRRAADGGYTIVTDNPADTQARTYHITADGKYKA